MQVGIYLQWTTVHCGALVGILSICFLNTYALSLRHTFMQFRRLAADCPIILNSQTIPSVVSDSVSVSVPSGCSSNSLHFVPNLTQ